MLVIMKHEHTQAQIEQVSQKIQNMGYTPHILPGAHSVAIGITGNKTSSGSDELSAIDGVHKVIKVSKPYKLSGRVFKKEDTTFQLGDAKFGGDNFVVMAGPCAVESEEQTIRIAKKVKAAGATVLRGGAYKPRTSPYSFQGLGVDGLKILATARQETGLPVITEAIDPYSLEKVYEYADIIQLGTRNMQNFALLKEVSKLDKPVMLKRGMSATIDEWLMAAEYILSGGNQRVLLCERGLRHFDSHTRNMVDLAAVPVTKELSHLPVVVDPSHGSGRKDLVLPLSKASVAIGAHAIIVDVHDRPHEALCDGPQAVSPEDFGDMIQALRRIASAVEVDMA